MDHRIGKVVNHLNSHFEQRISFRELALMVNLSPSRLRHIFRVEVGMSLAKYVKILRLNRARELLETTFLSIKQIQVITGMNDESHFFRDFKRAYKLTPTKYREVFVDTDLRKDSVEILPTGKIVKVASK
ncbi:MAG TPA: helix-turn-helix domain-containing protein [Pyrinomonadaceae bacterium]|nr:helix-turn-helix domain-containing protein [Pyrinomonadaceae bacterium]